MKIFSGQSNLKLAERISKFVGVSLGEIELGTFSDGELCVAFKEIIRWENLGLAPIAGLLYQGIVIAGLGFMVISYLLSRYPPSVIASFNFVSPISGVMLSAMLLGDQITPAIVGGVICVGAGLYFVSRSKAV